MTRPLTPGKFDVVTCAGCSGTLRSYASNPRRFCSRKCLQEHAREKKPCASCGGPIEKPASHHRIYCSKRCQHEGKKLEAGRALRNEAVATYQRHAAERGVQWLLNDITVDALFAANCHYCGDPPSNRRHRARNHGDFVYNGIDRVDSAKGYEPGNVVSCCFTCNSMKRDFTQATFIEKAQKIARRHPCTWQ